MYNFFGPLHTLATLKNGASCRRPRRAYPADAQRRRYMSEDTRGPSDAASAGGHPSETHRKHTRRPHARTRTSPIGDHWGGARVFRHLRSEKGAKDDAKHASPQLVARFYTELRAPWLCCSPASPAFVPPPTYMHSVPSSTAGSRHAGREAQLRSPFMARSMAGGQGPCNTGLLPLWELIGWSASGF